MDRYGQIMSEETGKNESEFGVTDSYSLSDTCQWGEKGNAVVFTKFYE